MFSQTVGWIWGCLNRTSLSVHADKKFRGELVMAPILPSRMDFVVAKQFLKRVLSFSTI